MKIRNRREELMAAGNVYTIIRVMGKQNHYYLYIAVCNGKMYVLKEFHEEEKYQEYLKKHEVLEGIGVNIPELLAGDSEKMICIEPFISGLEASDYIMKEELSGCFLEQMKSMSELCEQNGIVLNYCPTKYIVHNKKLVYTGCEYERLSAENTFEKKGLLYWLHASALLEGIVSDKKRDDE